MFPNQNCPACQAPNYSNDGCSNCFNVRNQQSTQPAYLPINHFYYQSLQPSFSQANYLPIQQSASISDYQLINQNVEHSASNYQESNYFGYHYPFEQAKANDWTEIHPAFTEALKEQWIKWFENKELTLLLLSLFKANKASKEEREKNAYQEARSWIKVGLTPFESQFAKWLVNKNYVSNEEEKWANKTVFNLTQKSYLQEQYVNEWGDLDPNFATKEYSWSDKTYQQQWKDFHLIKEEAQFLVALGFEPKDHKEIQNWKDYLFTLNQIQFWLEKGLKIFDYELANYLRYKGINPININYLNELRTDFDNWKKQPLAQEWLNIFYPQGGTVLRKDYQNNYGKTRNQITYLDINSEHLTGELDLSAFPNLEKLDCGSNQLTYLDLSKNKQLEELICYLNKFTNLNLSANSQLKKLNCRSNQLTNLILPLDNQLGKIYASNNLFSAFNWMILNPDTLTALELNNNNLELTDLSIFSRLINLESLKINNDENKVQQGIYNRWTGSLVSLQNCIQLKELDISNTGISQGITLMLRKLRINDFKFSYERKSKSGNTSISFQPSKEIRTFVKNQNQKMDGKKEFKWIDFSELTNFDKIAEGGHGKVFFATYKDKKVALKYLKKTTDGQEEYESKILKEITNHHLFDDKKIIKCIGISQNPDTQEYLMAMEYVLEGDLRNYLKESDKKISLGDKLKKLVEIATGLQEVHDKGLIHKDFHSGNILKKANECFLTDLGQCEKEAEQSENNQSFFGVLPYVAPEVLKGEKYTSAADIYSFGIIMIEMINQLPPHCYEDWNDKELKKKIINGFRPKIEFHIPQLFKDLIDKCLDGDPNKRPTAQEIKTIIKNWLESNRIIKDTLFEKQYLECQEQNKKINLSALRNKSFHPSTHYHSKFIPTILQEAFQGMDLEEQISIKTKRPFSASQEQEIKQESKKIKVVDYKVEYKKLIKLLDSLRKSEEQKVISLKQEIEQRSQPISAELEEGIDYQEATLGLIQKIKDSKQLSQQLNQRIKELESDEKKIEAEVTELEQSKQEIINKHQLGEDDIEEIEELLEAQKRNDVKSLERAKKRLAKYQRLTEAEINSLCVKQITIIDLQKNLKKQQDKFVTENLMLDNKVIGRGSFGEVYLGKWNDQQTAVKKLNISFASLSEDNLVAIKRELNTLNFLKQLTHPNIVKFFDSVQKDSYLYLIMEFANQGSLADYIKVNQNSEHDWNLNYQFMLNMTKGLEYLHSKKIVHRDLKSANVLINNNIAKLADFGLSKVKTFNTHISSTNQVGTTPWMAPEILLHSQPHSFYSDIYSLGMVFWEIVSKSTTPFKNLSDGLIIAGYCWGQREEIPNNTPKILKEIIESCWKEIPIGRTSLEQITTKINQILEENAKEANSEEINPTPIELNNCELNYLNWGEFISLDNEDNDQEMEALILEQREFFKDWNS